MKCAEFMGLVQSVVFCEDTEQGAKYVTHCLYPSSDPVEVFISRWGNGFRVTDGGGAGRSVWRHGRDDAALNQGLKKARDRFSVDVRDGVLIAETEDQHWLYPAILAVANASAMAAVTAVEMIAASSEKDLANEIAQQLQRVVPDRLIATQFGYRGQSGKLWMVDFAVLGERTVLLKAVAPHHTSISAGYTAFGDIGEQDQLARLAVYKRHLKPEDAALMRQVSKLLPVSSVGPATARELHVTPLQ